MSAMLSMDETRRLAISGVKSTVKSTVIDKYRFVMWVFNKKIDDFYNFCLWCHHLRYIVLCHRY